MSNRDYGAIMVRAVKSALADNVTNLAAAVAYNAFLAIPSALLVALGAFSLMATDGQPLPDRSNGLVVQVGPSQYSESIQVDADVVLIDEVLAVGDASFQQKCFSEFTRLKSEGRTIVFVTHDMGSVERFCDRALLLERGAVVDTGDPRSITRQYNELNFRSVRRQAIEQSAGERCQPQSGHGAEEHDESGDRRRAEQSQTGEHRQDRQHAVEHPPRQPDAHRQRPHARDAPQIAIGRPRVSAHRAGHGHAIGPPC